MVSYTIAIHKKAAKQGKNLAAAGLKQKVETLIALLKEDPFASYPPYEKLGGDMDGMYSRRINKQHRLVYEVDQAKREVRISSMWTHYE